MRHALDRLPFRSGVAEGYAATIELKWLAVRAGLRVVEEAITFRDRRAGSSKMSGGIMIEAAARVWALRKLPETGALEAGG